MLIKEILQGLKETNVAHADMSQDDRNRSMQMQSFLKHLESQMDKEDSANIGGLQPFGAPPQSFTSLKTE